MSISLFSSSPLWAPAVAPSSIYKGPVSGAEQSVLLVNEELTFRLRTLVIVFKGFAASLTLAFAFALAVVFAALAAVVAFCALAIFGRGVGVILHPGCGNADTFVVCFLFETV